MLVGLSGSFYSSNWQVRVEIIPQQRFHLASVFVLYTLIQAQKHPEAFSHQQKAAQPTPYLHTYHVSLLISSVFLAIHRPKKG